MYGFYEKCAMKKDVKVFGNAGDTNLSVTLRTLFSHKQWTPHIYGLHNL